MSGGGEERETKLGVDAGFVFPDLGAEGLRVADRGEEVLDAVYWDTPDLRLAAAAHGLRHRHGAGGGGRWTLKGPSRLEGDAVVRSEVEVEGDGEAVPGALLARLPAGADPRMLRPCLWLRTRRHRRDVLDEDGRRALEIVDDTVAILDAGGEVADRFREVEVELIEAGAAALAARAVSALRRAGAGPPVTMSKLVRGLRVLGHDVGDI